MSRRRRRIPRWLSTWPDPRDPRLRDTRPSQAQQLALALMLLEQARKRDENK